MDENKNVLRDDEGANLLNEQLENLSNASSDHNSSRGSSGIMSTRSLRKRKRKRSSVRAKISSLASQYDNDEKSSVQVLSKAIYIALFSLLGISFFCWGHFEFSLSQFKNDIILVLESSNIAVIGNQLAVLMREFHESLSNSLELILKSQEKLLESADLLSYYSRNTFIGSSGFSDDYQSVVVRKPSNSDVVASFRTPSFLTSSRKNTVPPTTTGIVYSFWELILHLSSSAAKFGNNLFNLNPIETISFFRDVTDNRNTFNLAHFQFKTALLTSTQEMIFTNRIIFIAALLLSIAVVVVIAVFLLAKGLEFFKRERVEVLNLFLWLPKSSINNILDEPKFSKFRRSKRHFFADHVITEETEVDFEASSPTGGQDNFSISIPVSEQNDSTFTDFNDEKNSIGWVIWLFSFVLIGVILVISAFYFSHFALLNRQEFRTIEGNIFRLQSLTIQMTTLDFIGVSRTMSFIATGELSFYRDYWNFLSSGQRENHLMNLLNYGLSDNQMERISDTNNIKEKLVYLETVAQYLAVQAHQIDWSSVFHISDFIYDLKSENDGRADVVRYSHLSWWYSNNSFDSSLNRHEQMSIAAAVVTNDRFMDLLNQNNRIIQSTIAEVRSSQDIFLLESNSSLLSILFFEGVFVLIVIGFIIILVKTKKKMPVFRHSSKVVHSCLILSIFCLVVSFVVLIFSFMALRSYYANIYESVFYFDDLIDLDTTSTNIRFYAEKFVLSHEINDYFKYWKLRKEFNQTVSKISTSQCSLPLNLCEKRALFIKSLENKVVSLFNQHLLTFSLISNSKNYQSVTSELDGHSWNVEDDQNYELIAINNRNTPLSRRYTNSTFDLNRDPEDQIQLAINLQFGNQMLQTLIDIYRNVIEANRNVFMDSGMLLGRERVEFFTNLLSIRTYLFILVFFILFINFFIAYSSTRVIKKPKPHVRQHIEVPLIKQFTKRFQISFATVLGFFVLFTVFSLYTFTSVSSFPKELSVVSTRSSQVWESKALLLDYLNIPSKRSGLKVELSLLLSELRSIHSNVLFIRENGLSPSTGRDLSQNNLLFTTNFTQTNSTKYGLHVVLSEYIALIENLLGESNFDDAFESSKNRLDLLSEQLEIYGERSLTLYRDEVFSVVSARAIWSRVFLALFVLVVVLELLFIFRKMLKRLCQEEIVDSDLIAMIPHQVVDAVPFIKNYVETCLH
ncbi:hypothetical protein P9112_008382 [Eukaryota sp. TZLM1-RC]